MSSTDGNDAFFRPLRTGRLSRYAASALSKRLKREQVQARKDKAVRFLRDVLNDPDRAAEVEDEPLEDYAARRHFALTNPKRKGVKSMGRERLADAAAGDRDELLDKVEELRDLADDILSEYEPGDEDGDDENGGETEDEDS